MGVNMLLLNWSKNIWLLIFLLMGVYRLLIDGIILLTTDCLQITKPN